MKKKNKAKYCNLDNLLEYNILEKFIKDYNTINDIASYLNKKSGETLNYFNNKKGVKNDSL